MKRDIIEIGSCTRVILDRDTKYPVQLYCPTQWLTFEETKKLRDLLDVALAKPKEETKMSTMKVKETRTTNIFNQEMGIDIDLDFEDSSLPFYFEEMPNDWVSKETVEAIIETLQKALDIYNKK